MRFGTALTKTLGVLHPIVVPPMRGHSGGLLAGAAANSGAVGLISVFSGSVCPPEIVKKQYAIALESCGQKPPGALGFGFTSTMTPVGDPSLELALSLRPRVIWFSFGDFSPHVAAVKASGALLMVQVFTVEQAVEAEQLGADVIVIQGCDAGGHGMQGLGMSVTSLVPEAKDCVRVPVVAAGGIVDGRGLASVLALGASGAAMGTRFVASHEAVGSNEYKQRVISARGSNAIVSECFDSFRPNIVWPKLVTGRALRNKLTDQYHRPVYSEQYNPTAEELETFQKSNLDLQACWVGAGVGSVKDLKSTNEIIQTTIRECKEALFGKGTFELIE
eukprot:c8843_g1_i1.p1 GENE.c8843_g1_i1~~c8843_g1_i1.p1  ORF type:complete len:333 (+),score=73.18 c8843_g1_i1:1028-2026(+)